MLRKLPIIALGLLVCLAVVVLLLEAVFPLLLDWRTFAAWRENRAAVAPMPFHAKVVDERGTPVEGAQITLRLVLHSHEELVGRGRADYETVILKTDAFGRARLEGREGFRLYVDDVSKAGYRWLHDLESLQSRGEPYTSKGFNYSPSRGYHYRADPDNPAVFPLYHEGVTQPDPAAGDAALPSRGGYTDGVRGEPFVPRASSLKDNPHSRIRGFQPKPANP